MLATRKTRGIHWNEPKQMESANFCCTSLSQTQTRKSRARSRAEFHIASSSRLVSLVNLKQKETMSISENHVSNLNKSFNCTKSSCRGHMYHTCHDAWQPRNQTFGWPLGTKKCRHISIRAVSSFRLLFFFFEITSDIAVLRMRMHTKQQRVKEREKERNCEFFGVSIEVVGPGKSDGNLRILARVVSILNAETVVTIHLAEKFSTTVYKDVAKSTTVCLSQWGGTRSSRPLILCNNALSNAHVDVWGLRHRGCGGDEYFYALTELRGRASEQFQLNVCLGLNYSPEYKSWNYSLSDISTVFVIFPRGVPILLNRWTFTYCRRLIFYLFLTFSSFLAYIVIESRKTSTLKESFFLTEGWKDGWKRMFAKIFESSLWLLHKRL